MRPRPDPDPLLSALRDRGIRFRQIRYRQNRTVLLSVSRDGLTLNSHVCFRGAPPRIVDAIAVFLQARPGSTAGRLALDVIRGWDGVRDGLASARRARPRRRRSAAESPTELSALFTRFNRDRFGGRLPRIPLRVSRRMTRSLGTISYHGRGPSRGVREIALSADLLRSGNEAVLKDTLLHEMAHAEAWLRHGHRGHGPVWRAVAERVGCTPRALIRTPVRGRR